MITISILYHSATGHNAKMAEAVAKGVSSAGEVKVNLISISGEDITKGRYKNDAVFLTLDDSDAIIMGTPTYMGGPSGQFKCFADATAERWSRGGLEKQTGGRIFRFWRTQRGQAQHSALPFHSGHAAWNDLGGACRISIQ